MKIKINPNKKTVWAAAIFLLIIAISFGVGKSIQFFRDNTVVFKSPIIIKTQRMVEVMSLSEYDKRKRQDQLINERAIEWAREIENIDKPEVKIDPNDPTVSIEEAEEATKSTSFRIIKPVEAKETVGYTYTAHSGKKYYSQVIDGLKKRFVNWQDAAELIAKESGFDPMVKNGIGACGLWQANPCSKMKCELSDVDCQLDWGKDYISDRYGTVSEALSFWKSRKPINGKDVGNWF